MDLDANRLKLGLHQANCYFRFLTKFCLDDVIQEVRIAVWESRDKSLREFNNNVNRNLYALARSAGYRKTNPGASPKDRFYGPSQFIKMSLSLEPWMFNKLF